MSNPLFRKMGNRMKTMNALRSSLRLAVVGAMTLFVAGIVAPTSSYANQVTFYITSDHCTDDCLTNQPNGGTILVTDAGGGVDLTFTLANGNKLIAGGIGDDYD